MLEAEKTFDLDYGSYSSVDVDAGEKILQIAKSYENISIFCAPGNNEEPVSSKPFALNSNENEDTKTVARVAATSKSKDSNDNYLEFSKGDGLRLANSLKAGESNPSRVSDQKSKNLFGSKARKERDGFISSKCVKIMAKLNQSRNREHANGLRTYSTVGMNLNDCPISGMIKAYELQRPSSRAEISKDEQAVMETKTMVLGRFMSCPGFHTTGDDYYNFPEIRETYNNCSFSRKDTYHKKFNLMDCKKCQTINFLHQDPWQYHADYVWEVTYARLQRIVCEANSSKIKIPPSLDAKVLVSIMVKTQKSSDDKPGSTVTSVTSLPTRGKSTLASRKMSSTRLERLAAAKKLPTPNYAPLEPVELSPANHLFKFDFISNVKSGKIFTGPEAVAMVSGYGYKRSRQRNKPNYNPEINRTKSFVKNECPKPKQKIFHQSVKNVWPMPPSDMEDESEPEVDYFGSNSLHVKGTKAAHGGPTESQETKKPATEQHAGRGLNNTILLKTTDTLGQAVAMKKEIDNDFLGKASLSAVLNYSSEDFLKQTCLEPILDKKHDTANDLKLKLIKKLLKQELPKEEELIKQLPMPFCTDKDPQSIFPFQLNNILDQNNNNSTTKSTVAKKKKSFYMKNKAKKSGKMKKNSKLESLESSQKANRQHGGSFQTKSASGSNDLVQKE